MSLVIFSFPWLAEEGSDRGTLVDTWYPAWVDPPCLTSAALSTTLPFLPSPVLLLGLVLLPFLQHATGDTKVLVTILGEVD